jgi:hypothetical protein
MLTSTRKQRLAAVALLLTVGMAGCAKKNDPTVATAGSGGPKTGANSAATGDNSDLKFSQCMRDQGLTWFPDPDPNGGLTVSIPAGTDQSTVDKAQEACKQYAPGASQNGGQISEEDLNKLRQVAQCIRDHGFSNYPDPDSNGHTQIDSKKLGVEPDDPAFQKAMQECQKYMPPRRSGGNS